MKKWIEVMASFAFFIPLCVWRACVCCGLVTSVGGVLPLFWVAVAQAQNGSAVVNQRQPRTAVNPAPSQGNQPSQTCAGEGSRLPFAWHRNPTGHVALVTQRRLATGVNYLSGIDVNHEMNEAGVAGEIFVTRFYRYLWPNAFGLGFVWLKSAQSSITARGVSSLNQQPSVAQSTVNSTTYDLNVFIRPTFESRWVSRAGLALTVLHKGTLTLDFKAAGAAGATQQNLTVQGPAALLLLESNPFSTFLVGLDSGMSLNQTFKAKDDTSTAQGKFIEKSAFLWAGVRHGFEARANHLELEIKVGAGKLWTTYQSADLGTQAAYTDVPLRASVGLGFVH